jgi:MSHA pilin protein MshD
MAVTFHAHTYSDSGFTLIELVVAMVIIAITVLGTLLSITTATRYSADPLIRTQAVAITQGYLSEIMNKGFPTQLPCPAPPAMGRAYYTNVCDYQGLVNQGAQDMNGNALAGLGNYTVQVNIDTAQAQLDTLVSGTQVVRVDVSVSVPGQSTVMLSSYRTKY